MQSACQAEASLYCNIGSPCNNVRAQHSCHTIIRTLVFSRLDYCNSLLAGAHKVLLDQLSCVMRASARLTLSLSKFSHVAVITREKLHWLDFPARVVFKLCLTAFRCLHGLAPGHLAGSCIPVSSVPGRSHLSSVAWIGRPGHPI